MNKIRILVANAPEEVGGVTCWRMFWPLTHLAQVHGHALDIRYSRGVIFPFEFYETDILICYRPSKPEHLQVIEEARRFGIGIVLDYDDDHKNIPVGHPAYWSLGRSWPVAEAALKMANLVWVSTPALAALYGHPNTVVVPNAVPAGMVADLPQDFEAATGIWAGSDAHREDADTFSDVYKVLLRYLNKFVWVNFMPTWAAEAKNVGAEINLHPWVHTEMWFDWLRAMQTTVIWKPLRSTPFNDGKSNISWISATVVGAVCVSTYAGKPGWECATREMPRNKKAFVELWERSAEEVRRRYNLDDVNEARFTSLLKLVNQ